MNIRTVLSFLAIIVALFIGGVMTSISKHLGWSYILWGLAVIIIIAFIIIYYASKMSKYWKTIKRLRLRNPLYVKSHNNLQMKNNQSIDYMKIIDDYQKMMNKDNANPDQCIIVQATRVCFEHLKDISGPYIVFTFHFINASVFTLKIEKDPTGHLIYEGQEIKDPLEFLPGGLKPVLQRLNTATIELRQFLLPDLAKKIMDFLIKILRELVLVSTISIYP